MTRHETVWSPDTCGCVIVYEWDDEDPPETRAHNLARVEKTCGHHAGPSHSEVYEKVKGENHGKNQAFDEAQKINPGITHEHYRWSFDKDRVLQVEIEGINLTAADKARLQTALHARLGNGKAKVK